MIGKIEIKHTDGVARTGVCHTAHGSFNTPAFMPVGTAATVKGVTPRDLKEIGAEIILANTYHLHLRPGDEQIKELGGLHKFMAWDGPILTDSGGFQVYSLNNLRKVTDEGVKFSSHLNGDKIFFTPEKVIQIQENLGVDIMMVLDECVGYPAEKKELVLALDRTLDWAKKSLAARTNPDAMMFGIVQGGFDRELRKQAVERTCELDFDGFALGGLSVGEPSELMHELFEQIAPLLPAEKPRYVMGVGYPIDIIHAVAAGVDMFDCVIPTRSARFGRLFTKKYYLNIKNTCFRKDERPIDIDCGCYTCKHFSRAYLSHLVHSKEALAVQLASIHNLWLYQELLRETREAIAQNRFAKYKEVLVKNWMGEAQATDC